MIERWKTAYVYSRWVRIATSLGLLAWGILLYALTGGFPPWAWRFLSHVLSQLPQLWAQQGSAVIVPLLGLVLLSLSLFVLWAVLLACVCAVVLYWWHHFHEHEQFARDLLEAERMAEEAVSNRSRTQNSQEYARWQPSGPLEDLSTQLVRAQPPAVLPQARPEARPPVLPQTRQPVRPVQPVQQPRRQQEQEEAYTIAARGSRVVGSSGLIRVPSAAYTANDPSSSQPGRRRQVVEARTQTLSVPTRPAPRVAVEPRTQPTGPLPRVPVEPRTQPTTRPVSRVPLEPRTQPTAKPVSRVPIEPRTQPTQVMQPTQAISRQELERARQAEASSVPTRALTVREQLHIVPRTVEEPECSNEYEDAVRFPPIEEDTTTGDTLPGTEQVQFDEDEDEDHDEIGDEDETLTELPTFPPVESFRLLVGIGLDAGIMRKDAPNEDSLFAIQGMRPAATGPDPVGLFAVADGMGGHAHGQEASKKAVNAISEAILPVLMRPADDDEAFAELLKEGVHRANLGIYGCNRDREHMMGTTLTAALIVSNRAYIVNIGDSRTYLYRAEEGLRRVTRDHSVVERLVEDGVITREEVYTHPKRNQIYRCLGERASVDVDMFDEELRGGDVLVLCSDGLWEMVYDEEIERIIMSSPMHPAQISTQLVQAALLNGGADNISVVVVCVEQKS